MASWRVERDPRSCALSTAVTMCALATTRRRERRLNGVRERNEDVATANTNAFARPRTIVGGEAERGDQACAQPHDWSGPAAFPAFSSGER